MEVIPPKADYSLIVEKDEIYFYIPRIIRNVIFPILSMIVPNNE